jgi:signal peptidase II
MVPKQSMTASASSPRTPWARQACLFVIAAVAGGCDQHTKARAIDTLSDLPGQTVTLVEPWLRMTLAYNRGTAFSLVRDAGSAGWVFAVLALFVAGMAAVWLWREGGMLRCVGAGLVAGGALGNAWDRVVREGVVDFIAVTLPGGYRWPTFNVADAALVVGVIFLLLAAWRDRKRSSSQGDAPVRA